MADDGLKQFEAILGAISNITSDSPEPGLVGARCPKCEASDFVKVSDLYEAAVSRGYETDSVDATTPRDAGLTDEQIIRRFTPPSRRSVTPRVVATAIPLGAAAGYLYYRFGADAGEFSGIAALVITVIVALTSTRRLSDEYYDGRAKWRKLFMCRKCGQLVAE